MKNLTRSPVQRVIKSVRAKAKPSPLRSMTKSHNGVKIFIKLNLNIMDDNINSCKMASTNTSRLKWITWAKTEIIYPKNVGALVAMNFT